MSNEQRTIEKLLSPCEPHGRSACLICMAIEDRKRAESHEHVDCPEPVACPEHRPSKPQGSHWDGCWEYGMEHYECAQKQVERLTAELAEARAVSFKRDTEANQYSSWAQELRAERDRLRARCNLLLRTLGIAESNHSMMHPHCDKCWDAEMRTVGLIKPLAGAAGETFAVRCPMFVENGGGQRFRCKKDASHTGACDFQ